MTKREIFLSDCADNYDKAVKGSSTRNEDEYKKYITRVFSSQKVDLKIQALALGYVLYDERVELYEKTKKEKKK
jgi:hypothetical protein